MSMPTKDDSFVFVNIDGVTEAGSSRYNITQMEVEPHPPQIKSMYIVSNVRNRYARTVVTSKYTNQDSRAQEATFSIVLPDTAFIAGFIMEIKGKKYEAFVKEKEEAKQEYQQAVSSGRAAAHVAVSARDSNKFTVSVNVEPQSDVTFILTYEELLVRKHSKYEMVVNLHPGQLLDNLGVDIHINETRPIINVETPVIRSGNEITDKVAKNKYVTIKKDIKGIVNFSFHPTVEQQKEIANALSNGNNSNGISGQFVVEYDVERDPLGGEVLVNDGYFVHFFAPTELKPIPKHVIFVLDVSGSMSGRKIEQLKEAMKVILSELNPEDYFNIIKFASDVQILYSNNSLQEVANTSLPAIVKNINKAQRVVDSMQAGGGTNISDALITALSLTLKGISTPEKKVKIQPIIIFLTDGQANVGEWNTDKIIESIEKRNDGENKSAIFTLAFGNDANKEFLKELAVKNSGFLRNIYEAADASLQLQDFYKQISSPLLTNVSFKYSREVKEVTKHNFDILFNGSEFVVTGKVDKINDGFVIVEGSTLYGIDDFRPTIIPICRTIDEKEKFGDLERMWAYMTIKQLLDSKYEKKNPNEGIIKSITPEKQALQIALKYSFVTPVTSIVVVKPEETAEADLQWGPVHVTSSDYFPSGPKYLRLTGGGEGLRRRMGTSSFDQMQQQQQQQQQYWSASLRSHMGTSSFDQMQQQQQQQQQYWSARFMNFGNGYLPGIQHQRNYSLIISSSCRNMRCAEFTPGLILKPLELNSMQVDSKVRNRYAYTVVTSKYINQERRVLQANFCIELPDTAFIAGFVMEIKGKTYKASMQNKGPKKKYHQALAKGLTAAYIKANADNPNEFTVYVNIEAQTEVTLILTYEQRLVEKNSKYEIVTNLHLKHTLQNLEVDVKISDTKPILNVETPVLRSNNVTMNSVNATINNIKDGSVHINLKPTVEQQKEIINILKETIQFLVEYKIETNTQDKKISVKDVPVAAPVTDLVIVKTKFYNFM